MGFHSRRQATKLTPMLVRCLLVGALTLCEHVHANPAIYSTGQTTATDSRHARLGWHSSSGSYGSPIETRFDAVSFGLGVVSTNWSVEFALPYLRRKSGFATPIGDDFASAGGLLPEGTGGWGDAYLLLTRRSLVHDTASGVHLDLSGAVKLDTGNVERGLSTGKRDYSLGAEVHRYFGQVHAGLSASYTRVGKIPVFGLRNHLSSRLRLHWYASDDVLLGASLHAGRPLTEGGPSRRDVGLNLDVRLYGGTRLDVYAHKGLADGSPDRAFGARISVGF